MREKYFILARQINTRKHHGDISILKLKTGRRRFTRGEISENNLITELKLRPHEISSKLPSFLRLVVVDQKIKISISYFSELVNGRALKVAKYERKNAHMRQRNCYGSSFVCLTSIPHNLASIGPIM